ncbi:hypothetical protein ACVW1A_008311 [Bradyrhizobium sp. LB1.3]
MIKDGSFRFGNTKFTLTDTGKAQIKNVVTDPATAVELSRHCRCDARRLIVRR